MSDFKECGEGPTRFRASEASQTHLSVELSMTLLVFLRFYELETKKVFLREHVIELLYKAS